MATITSHKDKVIEECQKIAVLSKELSGAASRFFGAPIYDDDFEVEDRGQFGRELARVRRALECTLKAAEGMDPGLDECIDLYKLEPQRCRRRRT